ncbi:MAG: cohesin domain-containing protein [Anaerolineae bacterium]|nr:cohesin domain-containing protein [Anaerolineae bacterium]
MLQRTLNLLLVGAILLMAAAPSTARDAPLAGEPARVQEARPSLPAGAGSATLPPSPSLSGAGAFAPASGSPADRRPPGQPALPRQSPQAAASDLSTSEKTATPTSVRAGDPLTYTIVLRNNGPSDTVADLTDPVPAGTTYVQSSATATAGTITYTEATNLITWHGTVAVGQPVTLTFSAQVAPGTPANTPITNTATVDDHVNPPLALEATALVADAANLSGTSKAVDKDSALPGDVLTYTVTLLNTGNRTALVSFSDPIPEHTTYVPGSVSYADYDAATDTVRWVGMLPATASRTIVFRVSVDEGLAHGTLITNTASITNVSPRIDRRAVTVISAAPSLSTSMKSVQPAAAGSGDVLAFTIAMTNTGAVEATAWLTDPIPLNTSFVAGSLTASAGSPSYDAVNGRVLWTGLLPVGTPAWVNFAVEVTMPATATGAITNTATIADGYHPSIERSASALVPLLWLACPSGTYYSGDTFDATLLVSNVPGLQSLEATITFVTSNLEVVGITPGSWFSPSVWTTLSWDNVAGTVDLAAALDSQPSGISGSGVLATLHLRAKGGATSALNILSSTLSGTPPPISTPIGHNRRGCPVTTTARVISGSVVLQGAEGSPEGYGGVQVLADGVPVATTDMSGAYSFLAPATSFGVTLSLPGYFWAQRALTPAPAPLITLPDVTLLGGDPVGGNAVVSRGVGCPGTVTTTIPGPPDGAIDIQDLTFVLAKFGMRSGDPGWGPDPCYSWYGDGDPRNFGIARLADINRDGVVDIRDLVMVSVNYKRSAPSPWP